MGFKFILEPSEFYEHKHNVMLFQDDVQLWRKICALDDIESVELELADLCLQLQNYRTTHTED